MKWPLKREEPGTSKTQADLDFFDALRKVWADEVRITKREWADRDTYGLMKDGLLSLHNGGEPENVVHAWMISDGDMAGTDWIVLP